MDFKQHFIEMLDYDRWAMTRVFAALTEHRLEGSKELEMFVHISLAQLIWIDRMRGVKAQFASAFDTSGKSLAEAAKLAADAHAAVEEFIADLTESKIHQRFDYRDLKGNPYTNTFREVLTHLFNHGSHHRAQINMMLRARGIEPKPVDFIFMTRDPARPSRS